MKEDWFFGDPRPETDPVKVAAQQKFERKQTMVEGFITGCIIVFAIIIGLMLLRGIGTALFG